MQIRRFSISFSILNGIFIKQMQPLNLMDASNNLVFPKAVLEQALMGLHGLEESLRC